MPPMTSFLFNEKRNRKIFKIKKSKRDTIDAYFGEIGGKSFVVLNDVSIALIEAKVDRKEGHTFRHLIYDQLKCYYAATFKHV